MNQLLLSNYGTKYHTYALGVLGDKNFQRETENLLVNYGVIGTTASFHSLYDGPTEGFGYFVIDFHKFYIGLGEFFQNMIWIKYRHDSSDCRGRAGASRMLGLLEAKKFIANILREDFMSYIHEPNYIEYKYSYTHHRSNQLK